MFYVFGVIGVLWFISWSVLVTESPPQQYQSMNHTLEEESSEEDSLIAESMMKESMIEDSSVDSQPFEDNFKAQPIEKDEGTELKVPWRRIILSPAVWTLNVGIFCQDWIWFFIITEFPLYYKNVLNVSVMESGMFSTLPVIMATITHTLSGFISDHLEHGRKWGATTTRRFIAAMGLFPTAVLLVLVGYTKQEDVFQAVVYTTLCAGVLRFSRVTYLSNMIDLSPSFTGIITGMALTFSLGGGIVAPALTGVLTNNNPSSETYKTVFLVNAAVCLFGGVVSCFLSGDVQIWDPMHSTRK